MTSRQKLSVSKVIALLAPPICSCGAERTDSAMQPIVDQGLLILTEEGADEVTLCIPPRCLLVIRQQLGHGVTIDDLCDGDGPFFEPIKEQGVVTQQVTLTVTELLKMIVEQNPKMSIDTARSGLEIIQDTAAA